MNRNRTDSGLLQKVLSHRVRGFAAYEHCPSAFMAACGSRVPYLEIDTRVSSDGEVFVYHDPCLASSALTSRALIAETPGVTLRAVTYANGERLLRLDEALAMFAHRICKAQVLCIDIKDYGFEEQHLRLVRDADLELNVTFISWIPQTLIALNLLGAQSPLVLSYWNVRRYGVGGRWLCRALENRVCRIFRYVIIGRRQCDGPLDGIAHGYQHVLVCDTLPDSLATMLAKSGGGMCVHVSSVSHELSAYCQEKQLRLWVFSARSEEEFLEYALQEGVHVVFCDDAKSMCLARRKDIGDSNRPQSLGN